MLYLDLVSGHARRRKMTATPELVEKGTQDTQRWLIDLIDQTSMSEWTDYWRFHIRKDAQVVIVSVGLVRAATM